VSGERLELLEHELGEHFELLKAVRDYLTTDEAAMRVLALEVAELREYAGHLGERVAELERAGRPELSSRELVEHAHRADELELTGRHAADAALAAGGPPAAPGRLVVFLESEHRHVLGQYVGELAGVVYYLTGAGTVKGETAELVGVVGRDRLDDVLTGRADR
jgi:hypothetical protein